MLNAFHIAHRLHCPLCVCEGAEPHPRSDRGEDREASVTLSQRKNVVALFFVLSLGWDAVKKHLGAASECSGVGNTRLIELHLIIMMSVWREENSLMFWVGMQLHRDHELKEVCGNVLLSPH